eukprot:jgi/Undpi1/7256/HiC_scaffold_22.g09729.m1
MSSDPKKVDESPERALDATGEIRSDRVPGQTTIYVKGYGASAMKGSSSIGGATATKWSPTYSYNSAERGSRGSGRRHERDATQALQMTDARWFLHLHETGVQRAWRKSHPQGAPSAIFFRSSKYRHRREIAL